MLEKPKRYKNEKYLSRMRGGQCCIEGCPHPSVPHHENNLCGEAAKGSKNDYYAIRMCSMHHKEKHDHPRTFWIKYFLDPKVLVIKNLIAYIESLS